MQPLIFKVERYVSISYKDVLNELHTEYHFIPAFGNSRLLSPEEGLALFEEYKSYIADGKFFNLKDLEPQDLYNLFLQ